VVHWFERSTEKAFLLMDTFLGLVAELKENLLLLLNFHVPIRGIDDCIHLFVEDETKIVLLHLNNPSLSFPKISRYLQYTN